MTESYLKKSILLSFLLVLGCLGAPINADASADSITEALIQGDLSLSLRYRFGFISQDDIPRDAKASTLQTLLGYGTGAYKGVSGYVQFRNVAVIGPERYNSTINGKTEFPVEADPDATEVDQAYVKLTAIPETTITMGRRKLIWGNKRFVSKLAWRQNNRSFDGVTIENTSLSNLELKYAYAYGVNRAFTDGSPVGNFNGDFHFANAAYSGFDGNKITAYAYLWDFDDEFALGLTSQTYGISLEGRTALNDDMYLLYTLEYANQTDYKSNTGEFDLDYYRVEPGVSYKNITIKVGYEVLSGDGARGFQTPFALLHAFNGWADKFVVTPADGLEDLYASLSYTLKSESSSALDGTTFTLAYHDFNAEHGSLDYGDEWDASIVIPFLRRYTLAFDYADYDAQGLATDTKKFWMTLSAQF